MAPVPTPLRILTGQTASGKSSVAARIAASVGAEVISVDSMKVYKGLEIGTAKPPLGVRSHVTFHMVDVVDCREVFTLAQYVRSALACADDASARGRHVLFAGGTPLYLRGLVYGVFEGPQADWDLRESLRRRAEAEGPQALHEELRRLDPPAAARLHPHDLLRIIRALEVAHRTGRPLSEHQTQFPAAEPRFTFRMVALQRSDEDLRARIARRTEAMFAAGLVAEVERLLRDDAFNRSTLKAIGYQEVIAYLQGACSLADAVDRVKRNTWRMARKQRTWLKSFPGIHWLPVTPEESPDVTAGRAQEILFGPEAMN